MALKYQPILLILEKGERLECGCGALAIIVTGKLQTHPNRVYNILNGVDVWCQECYEKAEVDGD